MRHLGFSILLIVLSFTAYGASGSAIAGKWNCIGVDERGTEVPFTLAITDQAGKLSGSLTVTSSGDKIDILEPALNGSVFTFKIQINAEEIVELTLRVDGGKLEGTFKGKASGTGTIKGTLDK